MPIIMNSVAKENYEISSHHNMCTLVIQTNSKNRNKTV